jgi:malate/lactate dehydrogenase
MAKQKKEKIENSYSQSHTITTIEDVKKRLDGMKKSDEFNKNLKIAKDNVKKMNSLETPLGTIYTSSGSVPNRKVKSIFVKK